MRTDELSGGGLESAQVLESTGNEPTHDYKRYQYPSNAPPGTLQALLANPSAHSAYMQDPQHHMDITTSIVTPPTGTMTSYVTAHHHEAMLPSISTPMMTYTPSVGIQDVASAPFALYSTQHTAMFGAPSPPKAVQVHVTDAANLYGHATTGSGSVKSDHNNAIFVKSEMTTLAAQNSG